MQTFEGNHFILTLEERFDTQQSMAGRGEFRRPIEFGWFSGIGKVTGKESGEVFIFAFETWPDRDRKHTHNMLWSFLAMTERKGLSSYYWKQINEHHDDLQAISGWKRYLVDVRAKEALKGKLVTDSILPKVQFNRLDVDQLLLEKILIPI